MKKIMILLMIVFAGSIASAREFHVAPEGNDNAPGTSAQPLKTIGAAATLAQPGDMITVHAGVYRERVSPPRGGTSDNNRIVYQAAPGNEVIIKGSEIVTGWTHVQNDTWKISLPKENFGDFNPYDDVIDGDWFNPLGRVHHTGAVYLRGHWLTEATSLDEVLAPIRDTPIWSDQPPASYLLNVAWYMLNDIIINGTQIPAASFDDQHGIQTTNSSEGGECIGWIVDGDWVRYQDIDFREGTDQIHFRAASATEGGIIEIRKDNPTGELLGSCEVKNTGDWQSWSTFSTDVDTITGIQSICLVFRQPKNTTIKQVPAPVANPELWFAQVDEEETTIWAQFKTISPNDEEVEINVRQTVFYPEQTGINYITVRGFTMRHAATPWAPPTAEQIGLLGTNWSKGWIIEDNDIQYSTCVGITLGKYGDEWDNTSQNSAEGYVETINRALENGWDKDTIGHHVVRNNHIAHCEQAGIVGSLGAIFSTITNNVIHDIHVRRLFSGAEMAAIKLHAPIDTEISNNHIYNAARGIWLDWMAQGSRVTRNLLHDNGPLEDLFMEVNHGPYMIDNNLFLSATSLYDWSQGGAYAHNLFAGRVLLRPELSRETPYHLPHSTALAGLKNIAGGDNRFYNNIFVGTNGLTTYDDAAFPVHMSGNLFLNGATPSIHEAEPAVKPDFNPELQLIQDHNQYYLEMIFDADFTEVNTLPVTTEMLGHAIVPGLPYKNVDGTDLIIDTDYFGKTRNMSNPTVGPFEHPGHDRVRLEVRNNDR